MSDGAKRQILLVDDEKNFRWGVQRILEMRGYAVEGADSGEAALELLQDREFDLVITDIRMPGMDGFELVSWLRAHRPEVRVMMTTGYDSTQAREQSERLGALSYLEKPVDLKELTDRLAQAFSDEGFVGRVQDLKLFDYLQLLSTTRKDKILEVSSRFGDGHVHLREGFIVHADTATSDGVEAFFEIMSWPGGDITDLPPDAEQARTIHDPTAYLLLEAARRNDAAAAKEAAAPPPQQAEAVESQKFEDSDFYRKVLKGLDEVDGLEGALLMGDGGSILARAGDLPWAIESIILPLCEGCARMGEDLGLGRYDEAILHLRGGQRVLVEPLGPLLLGVRVAPEAEMADVRGWIRDVAWRAGGRVR